jgi:hypothetical protein
VTLAGVPLSCIVAWPLTFWNLPVLPVTASRNEPEVLDRDFPGIRAEGVTKVATGATVRLRRQGERPLAGLGAMAGAPR